MPARLCRGYPPRRLSEAFLIRAAGEGAHMLRSGDAGSSSDAGSPRFAEDIAPVDKPVHVLVAVDNEVLRAGIAALIRSGHGFAVSEAPFDSARLVENAKRWRPDVLVVDLEAVDSVGGALAVLTKETVAELAVVAVVPDVVLDVASLKRIIQWGVSGIITLRDGAAQFRSAVETVRRGGRWLSPVIGGYLLDKLLLTEFDGCPSAVNGTRQSTLTERERSVLALVADGLTISQIARRLHRSESAVKYHLANLSARFQANNRAHLVYLAIRSGELQVGVSGEP